MSLLQIRIGAGVLALLALLTLRRQRWAYFAFVLLGLAYFPAQAHFHVALHFPKCEQLINKGIVLLSLQDYVHIALFAGFYWLSWVQFRQTDARILWAFLATLVVGALLEIVEGMSLRGAGHCRVRDLVPAGAGALGAALLLAIWARLTRKPGYVRLVKKGQAVARGKAPRAAAPLPPPPRPLYGLPTVPTERVVPPPVDFSPAPSVPEPEPEPEPTEEVAPVREGGQGWSRAEIVQRLRAIRLGTIWQRFVQRLVSMLRRLWLGIWGRRRAIVIGVVVLLLVGVAAVVLLVVIPGPAPTTVAEQPQAPPPPPPPPRPLQSEAEGYYEPDYQFTIGGRRFLRLTLRPQASLTFAKYGGRQQDGCADARIGQNAVYVRCDVERVGIVTIDGRFTSRYATSRLDAGVLSAAITVTNPRGEVLYRARDSFRWHEPE
jgi:hypothetical protein